VPPTVETLSIPNFGVILEESNVYRKESPPCRNPSRRLHHARFPLLRFGALEYQTGTVSGVANGSSEPGMPYQWSSETVSVLNDW